MLPYRCSVIADPDGPGWSFAEGVYGVLRQRMEDVELNRVRFKRFRDGEMKPKIESNVRSRTCFFIHDSNKPPSAWVTELLLVNQALRIAQAHEVVDVLPYLMFSRQDRKDESRVSISAQALTNAIEPYAQQVLTLDVHNPAIQGFYEIPFDNLYSFPSVVEHLRRNHPSILERLVVASTDIGGAVRARAFAHRLGADLAISYKHRSGNGQVEEVRILGDVRRRNVLFVDDIVDSGGTLIEAANAAREEGAAHVYAYCTHGLFTRGVGRVASRFDRLFIGDTVKRDPHKKLDVITFVPLFAEAIYRTSHGLSLSELFK